MINKQSLFSIVLLAIFCVSCKQVSISKTPLSFEKLSVNTKHNPSAIESKQPLFSWAVNAEEYNKSQSAFHVLVASSREK